MTEAVRIPPRVERVKIGNFRVLRNVEFDGLAPLSVLLGPNGSGKSTVCDVFAFLSDCFSGNLRRAVDKRGSGLRDLRSHGRKGPISFEIAYREGYLKGDLVPRLITYGLETPDGDGRFRVTNRIVVEELEAWFFGDVPAPPAAYPGISPFLAQKHAFRDPDAISGGTWERLFQVLQAAGYYRAAERLPKLEVARNVAAFMVPGRNLSPSFRHFVDGLAAMLT